MAVPDHSIAPRLLECAKAEFLAFGFEKASLKRICEASGVTTGAVYKRYAGKEELFATVVAQTISDINGFAETRSAVDPKSLDDDALIAAWDMGNGENTLLSWFRYLNERRDGFVLLIKHAAGTRYSDFQHEWVEKICGTTYGYYEEMRRRGLCGEDISFSEMHILMTAFWSTVYEPFIHDYDWSQIERHCEIVCRLFDWKRVFKLKV